ncbi:MAG: hypothetical protein NW223_02400 [Hyphomicrobiaceae bacterium]|nr:hypothetical protein [Hyphomicrobiaceae bacterium]
MAELISQLESARSQIEDKFSKAGTFFQDALALIEQQLKVLGSLTTALDPEAIGSATEDLFATAESLHALPGEIEARSLRMRELKRDVAALRPQIHEICGLLRYLRAFAFNVKITAAGMGEEAAQFSSFSQEMGTRIDQGDKQIREFMENLEVLDVQIEGALKIETALDTQVRSMLPQVPQCLSNDASAMRAYNLRVSDATRRISELAREVQMHVLTALSSLQIGDTVRQRIEHVQSGLQAVMELVERLKSEGAPEVQHERLASHVKAMLAAQLMDTAETFDAEIKRMMDMMAQIADGTNNLVLALDLEHGDGNSLRGLEQSVAQAFVLVEGMERATEQANGVQVATGKAVQELLARVGSVQEVKDEVQYMALNTSLRCVHIGEIGRPLQVVATELSTYSKHLEGAAASTMKGVERLAATAQQSGAGSSALGGKKKLEGAVVRLKGAADVVEVDLKEAITQGKALVGQLANAAEKLNFKAEMVDIIYNAAAALSRESSFQADLDEISTPLAEIMGKLARTYTMARERQVHAEFAPGGMGIEDVTETQENEDAFEMFA